MWLRRLWHQRWVPRRQPSRSVLLPGEFPGEAAVVLSDVISSDVIRVLDYNPFPVTNSRYVSVAWLYVQKQIYFVTKCLRSPAEYLTSACIALQGDPYVRCERPDCVVDEECPSWLACISQECEDPCNCGPNAECRVVNHRPQCLCRPGYEGNAFVECTLSKYPDVFLSCFPFLSFIICNLHVRRK